MRLLYLPWELAEAKELAALWELAWRKSGEAHIIIWPSAYLKITTAVGLGVSQQQQSQPPGPWLQKKKIVAPERSPSQGQLASRVTLPW
jgi:hypothetical protein